MHYRPRRSEEIAATPEAEAVILTDGRVVFSGIMQALNSEHLTSWGFGWGLG
jgi:hypothetical protein